MSCNDKPITSWGGWLQSDPIDPLDLFANVQLQGGWGTDQGKFVDSSTYITPPTVPTLLKVIGARVIDSGGPIVLANITNPITTQTVGAANLPDRIEIDFNIPPDPLSVLGGGAITLSGATTGPVAGAVFALPFPTTARLTFPAAFAAGDTYIVNANGTTLPTLKASGVALDGEALGLPSGNGVAGGDFTFGVRVIAGGLPIPGPPAPLPPASNWNPSLFSIASNPLCIALHSDNMLSVADAAQWNFRHKTANISANLAPPLAKAIFFRAGEEWQMNAAINLGYLSYSEIQLSILSNAGTRGDCQGTVPAVIFNSRIYSGVVTLQVSLKTAGQFVIGIRAIDTNGYYSMYDSLWNVVN